MKQGKQRRRCSVWHFVSRMILVGCFAMAVFAGLGLLLPTTSHAAPAPPNKMNFQGRLTDASGNPLSGTYDMQFKLYSAATGGTLLWAETRTAANTNAVTVTSGLFSVRLGEGTLVAPSTQLNAVVAANAALYFEITIGADAAMTPRSQLATSAYAFNSDTLDGLDSTAFAAATGGTGYIQNQNASVQSAANFWINGAARADTSVLSPLLDTATATTLSIGTSNATAINLNQNVTVASGKSLTLAGGATANRPASPTEGMMWYDTATKQLLIYSNGKWQSDRNTSTKIVAASNASQALKDGADYVATGTGDQAQINAALTAAAGGKVYLTEGTYTINGSISVPNNTTLAGAGVGTVITIPNSLNTSINAITNTTTGGSGTGISIQDLRLEGNQTNQTSGTMYGIYFNGAGSGSGASAVTGGKIINVLVNNWRSDGIYLNATANSTITNSTVQQNGSAGIELYNSSNNTVSGTTLQAGGAVYSILVWGGGLNNILAGNTIKGGAGAGIGLQSTANNTVSNNTIADGGSTTANDAIYLSAADNNTIVGNSITDTSATSTNYAINISNSTSDNNYLANNIFTSTPGTSTINNAGTGTIYANQSRTENGGQLTNRTANNTEAFTVQNASGTNILAVDTTNSKLLIASALDTTTATTLSIGTSTATGITIGKAGITTTIAGTTTINPQTSTSTTLLCSNGGILSTCDSSVIAPTLSNFIRNSSTQQASANFNISGTGQAATFQASTSVLSALYDTVSAGTLSVGTSTATGITLGKAGVATTNSGSLTVTQGLTGNAGATISGAAVSLNASSNYATSINTGSSTGAVSIGNAAAGAITLQSASSIGLTGTTSITGATSGDALTVSNATSTGAILTLNDNATTVFTVADGGTVLAKNTADSTTAFQIQNASSISLFAVDTSNARLVIGPSGGNTVGTLLVLGNKTNEGDPTGVDGAMYYNSSMKSFRCYRSGAWRDCGTRNIEREFLIEDEFFSGANINLDSYSKGSSGVQSFGTNSWCWMKIGAGGSSGITSNVAPVSNDHPGLLAFDSASTNVGALFTLNGCSNGPMNTIKNTIYKTSVSVTSTTGSALNAGIFDYDGDTPATPMSGVWWQYNSANTYWKYCYHNGTAAQCADSSVTTASTLNANFARLEIRTGNASASGGTSNMTFIINGNSYPVSGVNIKLVNGADTLAPAYTFWSTNGSSKYFMVDYLQVSGVTDAIR